MDDPWFYSEEQPPPAERRPHPPTEIVPPDPWRPREYRQTEHLAQLNRGLPAEPASPRPQPGFTPQPRPYQPPRDPRAQPQVRHGDATWTPPPRPAAPPGPYRPPQPFYGYQGAPPQLRPPRPRPRKSRKGLAFAVFGAAGALVAVIAAVSASHPSPSQSPAAPGSAAAPAQGTAPAAAPETVATFSGSGITNTPQFAVSSTWKLDYSFDCSGFGDGTGNFIILEDGTYGAMEVDELAASKTGSSYAYDDAGTHYLEVDSECSWTLKIIDEG